LLIMCSGRLVFIYQNQISASSNNCLLNL
jgi:hypothetical protein